MRSLVRYAEKAKKLGQKVPWLYKVVSQAYIDYKFPRHIFLETTAKCNLTCSYCPREKQDDHMDLGLFKTVIEEATSYGPRSFSLHLFGEPLLWPHILDGISFIKQSNKHHVVLLTTNGTHLNRYVDSLIGLGVDEILWTWRTEARFKPQTVQRLYKSTKLGKTRFRVRLIKEITPPEAFKEWSSWPEVDIKHLHNYGGQIDLSRWNVPPVGTRHPCYHLWLAPAVAWNGNILLCCSDPHQARVLGNIRHSTMAETWRSQALQDFRRSHIHGIYPEPCTTCNVWSTYPDLWFKFQKSQS